MIEDAVLVANFLAISNTGNLWKLQAIFGAVSQWYVIMILCLVSTYISNFSGKLFERAEEGNTEKTWRGWIEALWSW